MGKIEITVGLKVFRKTNPNPHVYLKRNKYTNKLANYTSITQFRQLEALGVKHVAQMQTKLLTLLTMSNFITVNSLKVAINNVSVLMDHNWMLIRGIIIIKPQSAIRFMAS